MLVTLLKAETVSEISQTAMASIVLRCSIKKAVKSLISRLFCVFGRFQFLPEKCSYVTFAPRIIRIHLTRRKGENSGENRRFSEKRFLRANNAVLGKTEPFASKRIY